MVKIYDVRKLSPAEVEEAAEKVVAEADFDGDGKINFKEFVSGTLAERAE